MHNWSTGRHIHHNDFNPRVYPLSKLIRFFHSFKFKALKNGDRFFFTHRQNPYPFTPEQMAKIKVISHSFTTQSIYVEYLSFSYTFQSRNLGDIICDNTDINEMRNNVFNFKSETFACENNAKLDLNEFYPNP